MLVFLLFFKLISSEPATTKQHTKTISDYGDQIFNTIMENELLKVFFIITLMVCFVILFYFLMSACSGVIKLLLELIGVIISIYIGIALTNYIINEYLS